jgi:hypothetical protein
MEAAILLQIYDRFFRNGRNRSENKAASTDRDPTDLSTGAAEMQPGEGLSAAPRGEEEGADRAEIRTFPPAQGSTLIYP